MDYLSALNRRLDFILRFHSVAAEPFEARRAAAEPEYFSSAEHEIEWVEADDCLRVLGNCCLGLIQQALQNYLRAVVVQESEVTEGDLPHASNWFDRYCLYLENRTKFNWAAAPVPKERIEQINLCRNDITHDADIDSASVQQSDKHFTKYPISQFADELELSLMRADNCETEIPKTIHVTREKLMTASEDVRSFCTYVDAQRTR